MVTYLITQFCFDMTLNIQELILLGPNELVTRGKLHRDLKAENNTVGGPLKIIQPISVYVLDGRAKVYRRQETYPWPQRWSGPCGD